MVCEQLCLHESLPIIVSASVNYLPIHPNLHDLVTVAAGSACHAHISLTRRLGGLPGPSNRFPNLNSIEACFLSSVLTHLPAIQSFTQPLPASYLRVADNIWSGGSWVCWGSDNKETPVRLVDGHLNGAGRRFEIKCMDGLSNP